MEWCFSLYSGNFALWAGILILLREKKKQCGSDGGGMLPGIHEPIAQTNDQYPPSKGKTEKFKTCLEKRGRAKKLKWFAGSCLLFDTLCGPVFYFNGLELSISKVFVKPFLFLFFKKRDYTASETLSAFNSIYIIPFFSLERLLLFPAHSA